PARGGSHIRHDVQKVSGLLEVHRVVVKKDAAGSRFAPLQSHAKLSAEFGDKFPCVHIVPQCMARGGKGILSRAPCVVYSRVPATEMITARAEATEAYSACSAAISGVSWRTEPMRFCIWSICSSPWSISVRMRSA